jgi:hypothetical protein
VLISLGWDNLANRETSDNSAFLALQYSFYLFNLGQSENVLSREYRVLLTFLFVTFINKEELVHQCYLNTCIELQAMITSAKNAEGSGLNKIEHLLRLNFECLNGIINGSRGHLAGFAEIVSLSPQHKKEISEFIRTFVMQVMQLIEQGQIDGSIQNVQPAKTASALWGAIFWLPFWLHTVEDDSRKQAYQQWLSIIKYGLNKQTSALSFTVTDLAKEQVAPAGFDKNHQNKIK